MLASTSKDEEVTDIQAESVTGNVKPETPIERFTSKMCEGRDLPFNPKEYSPRTDPNISICNKWDIY